MKIENRGENFSENLRTLDKLFATPHKSNAKATHSSPSINHAIDNGYSSLPFKELNNRIGILQIAITSLKQILNNDNITISTLQSHIDNTKFLGHKIYESSMVVKNNSGETLFDANRILEIIPNDEKDLYTFKKMLKNELGFMEHSLASLQDSAILQGQTQDYSNANAYLTSHSSLFAKAHNTAGLSARLDALLG